ncbi:transglycosylase SLT domain-containing protein [Candidatus Venteria ishoeyi]|uniref:Soluble lytic murein transglycosylase n=1 Tax=Candidatus Venteria ishoeyi TaxID=1899563 RepID=A0A1H6F9J7_9GAMM|nr:transglycosylase SLT domain-containing protein [Candidatus Venteria ishoeyi]SEH06061.1 Soluble lytic murein transglycosylase precursor [Candidatus Venteria ishoeyi]
MKNHRIVLLLCCLAFSTGQASEIYSYTDANGNMYFTNQPRNAKPKPTLTKRALKKTGFVASVEIYKYIDPKGIVHLTDQPPDMRYQLIYSGDSPGLPENIDLGVAVTALGKLSEHYAPLIRQTANLYQLDPALIHAVVTAESAYNADAISPKGAVGLMQLMPATAKHLGVRDRYDPADNLDGGTRYLKQLLGRFNDIKLALAAYNAGEGAVMRYGNKIPPYRETQNYVVKVMDLYARYQ